MVKPLGAAGDGRDISGKFVLGNKAGRGNPLAKRVAELRSAMLRSVSPRDVERVVDAMLKKAKAGDVIAARELLDRTIGKSVATDILQRLEALERIMGPEL